MGTLVGLRYGLGRNYTGSLMELNNCGYTTSSCDEEKFQDLILTSNKNSSNDNNSTELKQSWNNPNDTTTTNNNDNNNKLDNLSMALWLSKQSRTFGAYEAHLETSSLLNSFALDMHDFSKCHLFTEKPSAASSTNSSNAKNLLGLTQLIGLSRLMNFIMYKSRQSNTSASNSDNNNNSSSNNNNNNNDNSNPPEDAHRHYQCGTFTDYIFAKAQMEQKARRRSYYYPILQTLSHSSSLNTSLTCINELQHTGVDTESFLVNFLHKQRKRRHYNSESGLLLPETDNLSTPLQADSREGDPQGENNDGSNPEHDNTVNLCDDSILSSDSKETETSTLPSEVHMNATESENDASSESAIENSKSDENFASSPSLSSSPIDNDMENASKVNISKTDAQYTHETVNNNTTTTVNTIPLNDQSNVITASNIMKSNDAIDDQDESCDQTQKTTITKTSSVKENLKLHKSVSFADEVGKSLTEIFILYDEDDEENDHSHEYEELYGVSYYGSSKHEKSSHSPYRRSKFEIFCEDAYLDFTHNKKNHHHTNENNNDVNGTYKHLSNTNTEPHYTWSLTFSQPASHYYEFRQKLERSSISLESISVIQSTDQPKTSFIKLSGTIKVKNIAFEKSVFLRLTKNNWKTYTDYQAVYSAQLSSGTWSGQRRYDTFVFNIIIQSDHEYFHPDEKIEFAICFTTVNNNNHNEEKTEYWDNYDGKNYVIEQRKFHPLWIGTGSLTHHSTEISSPSSDASISPVSETPPNNNNKSISTALDRQHSSITSAITKTTPTPTLSPSTSTTHTTTTGFNTSSYTLDCRPNFDSFTSFTDYRAWSHYSGETSYY